MNLFELFVKIGVDDQASGKLSKLSSSLGKGLATAAKIGTAAVGAAAAGITALTTSAVNNYAEYEQLVGGVETLFKDSANALMSYAGDAYKAQGISANEYMSLATSFSASLLQSLEGDTDRAVEATNLAITDMSDNANKMGTSMEMIQNAYNGFAKANYTMLDNLKLGYGGTKQEMERLIEDANRVKKANGEMADLSIDSFADVVEAIHVVQTEMGITGTTAKEASETISGSVTAMKAAWKNLVTGIADDNADMEVLIGNFVETLVGDGHGNGGVINNILPRIEQSLEGVGTLVDTMVPIIVDKVPTIVNEWLPKILESGISMVKTIFDGMMQNSGAITTGAVNIISTFVSGISENLPSILVSAVLLIGEFAAGMAQALPDILAKVPEIVSGIVDEFAAHSGEFLEIGASIVNGILEGIGSMWASLEEECSGLIAGLQASMHFQITGEIVVPDYSVGVAHGGTSTAGKPSLSLPGKPLPLLPVDGSHAIGLDYVPFDGYIAELHKGERILTANEAYAYKNQKPSVSIVQNIYSESKTAADLMQEALYQQERAVLLGV